MAEQLKKKEYPARMFFRATLVCPSCLQKFREASESCPRCGFDAYRAVENFPFDPPVLEDVIDNCGIIDEAWRSDLDQAVSRLKSKFPQVGVHFCTVELEAGASLSEFGFWMMNACRLQPGQVERDRGWSLLFLLDPNQGLVSITPGYALEAFIEDSGWELALREISESLAAGEYRSALLGFIDRAGSLLAAAAKKVSKKISKS